MKRFTLEIGGQVFQAEGLSLKEVPGFENGLPEVWEKNKDKIVEEDITESIELMKELEARRVAAVDYLLANFDKIKAIVDGSNG